MAPGTLYSVDSISLEMPVVGIISMPDGTMGVKDGSG
jgi:hypothetical protein